MPYNRFINHNGKEVGRKLRKDAEGEVVRMEVLLL